MMSSSAVLLREPVDVWRLDDDEEETPLGLTESASSTIRGADGGQDESYARDAHDEWVRAEFEDLADELAEAAIGMSSTRRLLKHPAYTGILALGDEAIPLLLDRLRTGENRPAWLTVLGSLTTLPPAAGASTIDAAANAWLRWQRHDLKPLARRRD
jgi:hypothetical protein